MATNREGQAMRSRRRLWCLGAGVFLLLGGGALFLAAHVLRDRITPDNCDRIQVGMSAEEVDAILGRPPDLGIPMRTGPIGAPGARRDQHIWAGDQWQILVDLDHHGRVTAKACYSQAAALRPSFWERVREALAP
jgi:hypothetical protein